MTTTVGLAALLAESEAALWRVSTESDRRRSQAVAQTTNDQATYALWRRRHERLLLPVANAEGRFAQPAMLRSVGVRLILRTAFVDYVRERKIVGSARDTLARRLRGTNNPRRALLDEHRDYILAVTSEVSVDHLLEHLADPLGPRLLREYRALYTDCFASFCEHILSFNPGAAMNPGPVPLKPEALHLKKILTERPGVVS
jgi:hypothetical protein